MKIINLEKQGKIVFIPQTIEDLWTIKTISDNGDIIKGNSYRRQRVENLTDSSRKPVYVSLKIEKFDFSQELDSLRFTGKIVESKPSDLAPLGDHHTIEIKLNQKYVLIKQNLFKYQIDLLKRSSSSFYSEIFLVVLDDESANIFRLTNIGIDDVTTISSNKSGKMYKNNFLNTGYFEKIYSVIKNNKKLIIAGPGHIKSKFHKFLITKSDIKNIIEVSIQNTSKSSISELFTKRKVSKFFENSIIYEENKLLNIFLENLGKQNNKAIYGLKDVSKFIDQGVVEFVLISKDLWKNKIDEVQDLIKRAEAIKTKIHVVDNNSDITRSINSFTGIIAVLRYSIKD